MRGFKEGQKKRAGYDMLSPVHYPPGHYPRRLPQACGDLCPRQCPCPHLPPSRRLRSLHSLGWQRRLM